MGPALPILGAGLGLYSSIKGAQQQSKANRATDQQLAALQAQQAAQTQIRNLVLGRLMNQPAGAIGNPFSAGYRPLTPYGPKSSSGV